MKFKMAAAAILNLSFLSILVKWSISGGSRLGHCTSRDWLYLGLLVLTFCVYIVVYCFDSDI